MLKETEKAQHSVWEPIKGFKLELKKNPEKPDNPQKEPSA
jgi:hypothetical protein